MPAAFDLSRLNAGQWVVIGLSSVLIVWLVAGIVINRREGVKAHAWLCSSLSGFTGGNLAWVDLATAASVLKPADPRACVEKIEAVFAFERRENLPLWLFHRAAGKRDSLIVRASLKASPSCEAHLVLSTELAVLASLSQGRDPPLERRDDHDGYSLLMRGAPAQGTLAALKDAAARYPGGIQRVSLRPERPQLLFHARLDALRKAPTGSLLTTIDELTRGA